jgi:cytochrome c oxidase subunit 2
MFRYLPEQASDFAHSVDSINNLITDISVFFTVLIVGAMIYFGIRYRRRGGVDHATPRIEGSHFLEVVWTVVPTIICIVVAVYGVYGFRVMREVPAGAIEINVTGRQWAWNFTYPSGKKTVDEFVVPVGKPIKLIITSEDVLHSFFVPAMRTKVDAVPGQYTYQWFRPIKTGDFQVFCTEYCGTKHSAMLAKLRVVSEAEFARWEADKGRALSPAEQGEALVKLNACGSCHSVDGSAVVGPTFLKLYGRKGEFSDGQQYTADENYIKESILYPQAHVVKGYPNPSPMPAFEGKLSDEDITNIIQYIKSLSEAPKVVVAKKQEDLSTMAPADRGKKYYQEKLCIGCHSLDGSRVVGPSFKGLYGKAGKFTDGGTYVADDAYITESILTPNAHVVEGYPAPSPMPAYEGQLSEEQVKDIIEFMKTLK